MRQQQMYNYIVYENGDVFSLKRNIFLKRLIDSYGYFYYRLYNNGKSEHWFEHKLIAIHFIPKIEGKNFVNHIDGNKHNNSISNLEWVTIQENNLHARKTGLNNVSKSNRERYKNEEFQKRVSEKISSTRKERQLCVGRKNPNTKIDLMYQGSSYTMTELSTLLGIPLSTLSSMKHSLKRGLMPERCKKLGITYIGCEG